VNDQEQVSHWQNPTVVCRKAVCGSLPHIDEDKIKASFKLKRSTRSMAEWGIQELSLIVSTKQE